ncbi:hypothetical protein [Pseudomonas protegens]
MRLPIPSTIDFDLINQVVIERQGGVNANYFSSIKTRWLTRIQDYRIEKGNPEKILSWILTDEEKTRFTTLYLSPASNSVQKPILDRLRSRTLQLCPACGEDGQPNTLDHYLPRNLYPELSITPINLSPMCDTCQGIKLAQTLSHDNKRLYLQPYFDTFLDTQAIKLTIGRPFHAPKWIQLTPNRYLGKNEGELISRHMNGLNYNTRYMRFFRDEYVRLLKLASRSRANQQDVRANILNFRDNAKDKSINSWACVFYNGVLTNKALMRYLKIGKLPKFV